jgi:hypothetical protein
VWLEGLITQIFSCCWCGWEAWSLKLWLGGLITQIEALTKAEVFENRVLGWIFRPKKVEVRGEWRRLHNEKLYALCPHQHSFGWSDQDELEGRGIWHIWGHEKCIQIFGGETREKETNWNTWSRLKDYIKIDLKKVECRDMYWIDLVHDKDKWRALVNA